MTLRSHTPEVILAAFRRGEKIWVLDTGSDGQDDTLIGNDRKEVMQSVIDNEDGVDVFDEDDRGWTLNEIGEGDEPLWSIIDELEGVS